MIHFFSKKNIVITGGTGFIAGHIFSRLKPFAQSISLLSKASSSDDSITQVNYQDIESLRPHIEKADIIFHLAAQTSAYRAEENPALDLQCNLIPLLNILEICKTMDKIPTVIFASTVTIFGIHEPPLRTSLSPDMPSSFYDLHKLHGEDYLNYYIKNKHINGCSLRLANVYGPGSKESSVDRGIINIMIKKILSNQNITIFGNGKYIRDFIYISDVANSFLEAAIHIKKCNGRKFIISSGQGHQFLNVINTIIQLANKLKTINPLIEFTPFSDKALNIEKRNFIGDNTDFISLTNWKPKISLEQGITLTMETLL